MEKIKRFTTKIILTIALVVSPFAFIGILFGLSGSNSGPIYLMALGYIGVVVFSLIFLFKQKYFYYMLVFVALIFVGYSLDKNFWKSHNDKLCKELRANPTCVEDACGFECGNHNGSGFSTLGSICGGWDVNKCSNFQAQRKQQEELAKSVLGTTPLQYLETKGIKPQPGVSELIDQLQKIILDNKNKTSEEIRGLVDEHIRTYQFK